MNRFEVAGRLRKVERYVEALDQFFRQFDIDAENDPAAVAEGLRKWTPRQWAELALNIGAHKPSPETISAIVDRYDARARAKNEGRVPCPVCSDGSCMLCDDNGRVPPPGFDDEPTVQGDQGELFGGPAR
jgi:hypothetical protein